jgi:hypothetical protein
MVSRPLGAKPSVPPTPSAAWRTPRRPSTCARPPKLKSAWLVSILAGLDDGSIIWNPRDCTKPPPDPRIDLIHYRTILSYGWKHPMKPLRLAILSATGTAQKRTIPALVNSNLVTVSAIQGRNPEKLRDISEKYGIQSIFIDEHELLAKWNPSGIPVLTHTKSRLKILQDPSKD